MKTYNFLLHSKILDAQGVHMAIGNGDGQHLVHMACLLVNLAIVPS